MPELPKARAALQKLEDSLRLDEGQRSAFDREVERLLTERAADMLIKVSGRMRSNKSHTAHAFLPLSR